MVLVWFSRSLRQNPLLVKAVITNFPLLEKEHTTP